MKTVLIKYSICIFITILVNVLGYEHLELLENGRKYSWKEASQKCRRLGGTLPNWTFLSLSQETEKQKLLNGNDTWTSLQLVNGYIQEVASHTSYTEVSSNLWEENMVWNDDTCVKLTAKYEFKAVKCSTCLSVVCQLQELQSKELFCVEVVPPILTVEVSGRYVNVEHGELNVRESEQNNVTFHCKASTDMSAFDWIKDGVYINARTNIIYPSKTEDPSKLSNPYSTQGTYWCEAWIPGCANKYHSNKINLKFKGVATVHLNLKKEEIADLNTIDILIKLKTLIPSHAEENILDFDVRRSYTPIGKQNISTYNYNIYIPANDQEQSLSTNGMEFASVNNVLFRRKRQNAQTNKCPKYFKPQDSYCYYITKPDTWTNAYINCFQNGIEKTPLDVKKYWLNQLYIEHLIQENITLIWLAAQRKVGGGPIYYSGPVGSDFDYENYSATGDFNVTWKTQNFNPKSNCLVLDIKQSKLDIISCEEQIPFVCLFPLEFWTKKITEDAFYLKDDDDDDKYPIQWVEASMECRKKQGYDLIDLEFIGHSINDENIDEYIGQQNSIMQSTNKSPEFIQWVQYDNDSIKLFQDLNLIQNGNNNKTFACMNQSSHYTPKLDITNENNQFKIGIKNTNEISFLYGIKCYLNGKLVNKNVQTSSFNIYQEGYLFCEALSPTPVNIITSDLEVDFPDVISFICEIFVGQQNYSFQLHDLTFQSKDNGSVLYYEDLLKKKLQKFNITILNATEGINKSGINIEFLIEVYAKDNQISHFYTNIYNLLQFNDGHWASKNVTLNYLRSTKYCISEVQQLPGCNTNITWPNTLLNEKSVCIECKRLQQRQCSGTFRTGGKWVILNTVDIPKASSNLESCSVFKVVEDAMNIVTNASNLTSSNKANSVTEFIHNFEKLWPGIEVNVRNVENSQIAIYSSRIEDNVRGYFLKEKGKFNKIASNSTSKNNIDSEDTISAVYFNLKNDTTGVANTTVLLTVFQNSTIFPHANNDFSVLSPIFLINVSNVESLSFPIHILHSVQHEDENNSSTSVPVCGYWNETTHQWEVNKIDKYEGISKSGLFNCTYHHLTCFAMLVRAVHEEHEEELNILTQIGCYLSLIGLGLVLAAFIMLRRWRDKPHDIKILFSLSFSLFVMYLLFLTGINQSSVKELCIVLGALLHYIILTSFCWMLIIAYHNYLKFDKVLGTYIPRFMLKASLGAWIIPIIPIIIILSINHELYTDGKFCWVREEGFYYGFLIPICFIWVLNVIVFIRILYKICLRQIDPSNKAQRSLLVSQVILSLFLFVVLGLSWVFGFLAAAQISVVFSYLFCITTTIQGFLIFVFFILLEKKSKDKWIKFFRPCFNLQEQVTSESRSRRTSGTELMQQTSSVSYSQQ